MSSPYWRTIRSDTDEPQVGGRNMRVRCWHRSGFSMLSDMPETRVIRTRHRARQTWQRGCRTPNDTTQTILSENYTHEGTRTYFKKHLLEVISFITDRSHNCDERTQPPRNQQGHQRDTCRIVNTAAAGAWQPYSKLCNTRMTSGQGNQSNA